MNPVDLARLAMDQRNRDPAVPGHALLLVHDGDQPVVTQAQLRLSLWCREAATALRIKDEDGRRQGNQLRAL